MTNFFKRALFGAPRLPAPDPLTGKQSMQSESLPRTAVRRAGRPLHLHRLPGDTDRRRHVQGGRLSDPGASLSAPSPLSMPPNCRPLRHTRRRQRPVFLLGARYRPRRASARGKFSGRPAGVHVNMAERLSLFRKGAVIVACRALGIPVVLHLHAAQLHHFYQSLARPLQALTRWVFSLPASVVVLGSAARQFVIEDLGVAEDRVDIVINGVPGANACAAHRRRSGGAAGALRRQPVGAQRRLRLAAGAGLAGL